MRKIILALAFAAGLFVTPAMADFTGKDASAATITFKNPGTCTSVVCVPVFQIYDGTNVVTLTTAGADAVSNTLTGVPVYARMGVYNGTTWDRWNGSIRDAAGNARGANVNTANQLTVSVDAGSVFNTNGQAAMASSSPVVIASNQSAEPLWGHGPVTPGTAATGSVLAGATFNSTAPTFTTGQQGPLQVSSRGGLLLGSGYPAGSTPITISGTGTTAATTATLATGASVTTYICGLSIRANATAAATGNATVTGTITGTLNFTQWTAPNASGLGVTEQTFTPCIPASAANTGIAVISAAPGTGGVVSVTAWGYTL